MTKQELIERVYRSASLPSDLTKKAITEVIDAAFRELSEYFATARVGPRTTVRFTYPGFGTFTKRRRGARLGRDPRTGARITIPASYTLAFAPGQDLKGLLKADD